MKLTLRQFTGGQVAQSMWLLADNTPVIVKMTQAEHDAWGGIGEPSGKPAPDAKFLMASGGIPELNTADGYAHAGDCWEQNGELRIAVTDGDDWRYEFAQASDPGTTKQSRLTGFIVISDGNREKLSSWTTGDLQSYTPSKVSSVEIVAIDTTIANSRSVTFDAKASGRASASTLTVAGTIANQADRHVTAMSSHAVFGVTLNSVAWNGTGLVFRQGTTNPAQKRAEHWDLVAPANGSFNMVWTCSAATDIGGGFWSAYGVDQTTPRTDATSATGTSTSPSGTVNSGNDELVLSETHYSHVGTVTCTVDATFTADWDQSASFDPASVGAHKTGASPSVTKTDTLSSSSGWVVLMVSLKAAVAGRILIHPGMTGGMKEMLGGIRG